MALERFLDTLVDKFELASLGTATLFSHPVILAGETFAKLNDRVESYTLTEVEEEHMRELTESLQWYKEIQAVVPGQPMPYKPDNRIIFPYNGKLGEFDLMIASMPQTRVQWKDNEERLDAVIATIGKTTRIQHPQRTAYATTVDGAAIYFENGVIADVTMRVYDRDFMGVGYFVPPEMDINKIHPPYERHDDHLAYPRDITDLQPLIQDCLRQANQAGIKNYAQRTDLREVLTRSHELALMFIDNHRELAK